MVDRFANFGQSDDFARHVGGEAKFTDVKQGLHHGTNQMLRPVWFG
jgi:hypothetical protein